MGSSKHLKIEIITAAALSLALGYCAPLSPSVPKMRLGSATQINTDGVDGSDQFVETPSTAPTGILTPIRPMSSAEYAELLGQEQDSSVVRVTLSSEALNEFRRSGKTSLKASQTAGTVFGVVLETDLGAQQSSLLELDQAGLLLSWSQREAGALEITAPEATTEQSSPLQQEVVRDAVLGIHVYFFSSEEELLNWFIVAEPAPAPTEISSPSPTPTPTPTPMATETPPAVPTAPSPRPEPSLQPEPQPSPSPSPDICLGSDCAPSSE